MPLRVITKIPSKEKETTAITAVVSETGGFIRAVVPNSLDVEAQRLAAENGSQLSDVYSALVAAHLGLNNN